jgi:hypothetical protein
MKIELISNGLSNIWKRPQIIGRSDILALLGNCISAQTSDEELRILTSNWKHVISVPGPGEYVYHESTAYYDNITAVRDKCNSVGIKLLDNNIIHIDNHLIIGSTLWPYSLSEKYQIKLANVYSDVPTVTNGDHYKFWNYEDDKFIYESIRCEGATGATTCANKVVVLSHFQPGPKWYGGNNVNKWFYGARTKPISGQIGSLFIAGGNAHELPYELC